MARNNFKMIIDKSKALRRLSKLQIKSREEAGLSTRELGEMGKQYARARAPYYSGKTFRNIVLKKGSGKYQAIIAAQNSTANDGHVRRFKNFNLVRWMHTSPNAARHIHSGDRQFMYSTRRYLNTIGRDKVMGSFKNIFVKA